MLITNQYQPNADIIINNNDTKVFIPSIPTGYVSLVVTSPPYNLGKEYEQKLTIQDYLQQQKPIIQELARVLSDDGSICWQVGNYVKSGEVIPLDILYYTLFKEAGFYLRNRIIWHFGHGLHAKKRFSGRYETVLWFTKSQEYKFNLDAVRVPSKYPGKRHYKGKKKGEISGNPKGKNPSDYWQIAQDEWSKEVWEIPNVKANHPEKTIHPCQYPVELVERCVLALTNEDDWVFDPFAGVGSSVIAAIKHKRKAIACEKEIDYCNLTRQRIQSFLDGTLKTRPMGKPVHVPSKNSKLTQLPEEWKQQA